MFVEQQILPFIINPLFCMVETKQETSIKRAQVIVIK